MFLILLIGGLTLVPTTVAQVVDGRNAFVAWTAQDVNVSESELKVRGYSSQRGLVGVTSDTPQGNACIVVHDFFGGISTSEKEPCEGER